jgi:hypothetical protein
MWLMDAILENPAIEISVIAESSIGQCQFTLDPSETAHVKMLFGGAWGIRI